MLEIIGYAFSIIVLGAAIGVALGLVTLITTMFFKLVDRIDGR